MIYGGNYMDYMKMEERFFLTLNLVLRVIMLEKMKLKVSNESWEISEEKGFAIRSDGMTINENTFSESKRPCV